MKNKLAVAVVLLCMDMNAQEQGRKSRCMQAQQPCPIPCNFEQGDQGLPCATCMPTYNYPASVKLDCAWDLFGSASLIYWYAGQDGMDLAVVGTYTSLANILASSNSVYFQGFDYTPGFKVGVGANVSSDQWTGRLDYTYLRSIVDSSTGSAYPTVWVMTNLIAKTTNGDQSLSPTVINSNWHLGLDILDGTISRPYYQGRMWTVTPFGGLRAAWIRETLNVSISGIPGGYLNSTSHNKSTSWSIGPRAGVEGHMILGMGARIQGSLGASMLFTQYSTVYHSENPVLLANTPVSYGVTDFNTLRPMMEAGLGLGWGWYCTSYRFHFDLSATYDFNYLWEQNMMRYLNDLEINGGGAAPSALYLHGLTINARFDF